MSSVKRRAHYQGKPLEQHFKERFEYLRRVAIGYLFTLKGAETEDGFIRQHSVLTLRCPHNHIVKMPSRKLLPGQGCKDCYAENLKAFKLRQLEDAQEIARSRNGECLSTEYVSAKEGLRWRCFEGHEWVTGMDNIRSHQSWCKRCAAGKPRARRRSK